MSRQPRTWDEDDVRIRPGRTDIRVAARDSRPDGGATCRLMNRIVTALEDEIR